MASGATVAVALRFYTRILVSNNPGVDDWLMLGALVSILLCVHLKLGAQRCERPAILILYTFTSFRTNFFVLNDKGFSWGVSGPGLASAHYGMGQHIGTLSGDHITKALMWVWVARLSTIVSFCLVKLSIAALLLRIVTVTKRYRYILYASIIINVCVSIIWFIMTIKCIPANYNWDTTVVAKCIPSHVTTNHAYFAGGKTKKNSCPSPIIGQIDQVAVTDWVIFAQLPIASLTFSMWSSPRSSSWVYSYPLGPRLV